MVSSVNLLVLRTEDDKMSPLSVKQAFLRMEKGFTYAALALLTLGFTVCQQEEGDASPVR